MEVNGCQQLVWAAFPISIVRSYDQLRLMMLLGNTALVTNIVQNILFYAPHKKEAQTAWGWANDDRIMIFRWPKTTKSLSQRCFQHHTSDGHLYTKTSCDHFKYKSLSISSAYLKQQRDKRQKRRMSVRFHTGKNKSETGRG